MLNSLATLMPKSWLRAIASLPGQNERSVLNLIEELDGALAREKGFPVYPPREQIFAALELTPPSSVKVVILGQDPYHGGQAHGLSFSVQRGVKRPPSLKNILTELEEDLGVSIEPDAGDLSAWAKQGVLLLNTVLSVRAGEAGSHINVGWEKLTDLIIRVVGCGPQPSVFLLWGKFASKKAVYIDLSRHLKVETPHPSPLSAYRGFFGSKPFSRSNAFLIQAGREPIDWAGSLSSLRGSDIKETVNG